MPDIALTPPSPLALRIAADARMTATDYLDDQTWQLRIGGGDPSALALETTYGLRCKGMRIFPSFRHEGETRMDPSTFTEGPVVRLHLPNYLRLDCRPFPDLSVLLEYWIPDSKVAAGRITLHNTAGSTGHYRLRLHAVLRADPAGEPMGDAELGGSTVLVGQTGGLQPIFFVSGSAQAEQIAHPALFIEHELKAGELRTTRWVEAGLTDKVKGLERARAISKAPWDAEIARVELANAKRIEVDSGNPRWDLAIAESQTTAAGSLMTGTQALPYTSFVGVRGPDHGFSARGTGRDHPESWAGQDAFAALHLGWQLLPSAPEAVKDIVRNFIHVQSANGEIDASPGLAGQRANMLAAPLLVALAWETFRHTGDRVFLREVYSPLTEFVEAWFSPRHDRDGDGAPEWGNAIQSGHPESPLFSSWLPSAAGLEPSAVESPDLLAYLLHECQCLASMADALGRTEDLAEIEAKSTGLRRALDRAWSEEDSVYRPLDRDLHAAFDGEELGRGQGAFEVKIQRRFDPMARLSVRIHGPESRAKGAHITIHGRGPKGQFRTERIESKDIRWFWEIGSITSANTFASIDRIEIIGLTDEFETRVSLADHSRLEIGSLLPLWPGPGGAGRVDDLVENAVLGPAFNLPGGIPACSSQDPSFALADHPEASGVRMLWNEMLGEGLLAAGYREEAAALVGRLLDSCADTLSADGDFRPWYSPAGGAGFGERGSVEGLAPLRLFLRCLGVRLIDPWTVELHASNPFELPVTIRWNGLTIRRGKGSPTSVVFPDGGEIEVAEGKNQRVERIR